MGRAGGGGGGSRSHSSGGGHSSGRSGGGHHVSSSSRSSSSRAGSGRSSYSSGRSSYSSGRSYGGGYSRPPRGGYGAPPPPPRYGYGSSRRSYSRSSGGGCSSVIGSIVALVIVIMIAYFVLRALNGGSGLTSGQQTITHNRTKLESGISYNSNCIIDELEWFENTSKTGSQLKSFYDETGVQPYIYLKSYDPSLTTDAAKDAWAIDYYDDHFKDENIFFYVYFAEQDTDNDVGYMSYANGQLVDSVMDDEAVDIFWDNIDRYWYTDYSTDEVFIRTFNDTAKTIMADVNAQTNLKSSVVKGIVKVVIVLAVIIAVIVVLIILIVFWTKKQQRKKEEAEETERILNTPMQDLVQDAMEKDRLQELKDKYDNQ